MKPFHVCPSCAERWLDRELYRAHFADCGAARIAQLAEKVDSLIWHINDALNDLPDRGADARATLRSALGLPDDD